MSKKVYISFFIRYMLCFAFVFPESVLAQINSTRFLTLVNGQIEANNGDLVSVDLKVFNGQPIALKGRLRLTIDERLELVSKQEEAIDQKTGETDFYEFKLLVPSGSIADEKLKYKIELLDENNTQLDVVEGTVFVVETKKVEISVEEPSIQIRNTNETMVIPVRLVNKGNTQQLISVTVKVPTFKANQPEEYLIEQLQLRPFVDTLIQFKKPVNASMLLANNFDVVINGIYENGDFVGVATTHVQSLTSKKKYFAQNETNTLFAQLSRVNVLELGTQFLFSDFETYFIRSAGEVQFNGHSSKLIYSIDGQFWKNRNLGSFFRNTYLGFESKRKRLVVGSLTRNFDMNLVGRGVSGMLRSASNKFYIEAGWMDEAFNLFQKQNFGAFKNGKSSWVNINIDKKNTGLSSVFIYQKSPLFNVQHFLLTNNIWHKPTTDIVFNGFAHVAYTNTLTGNFSAFSYAGGLNAEGRFGRLNVSSENYYSTPYYPGIKRGTTVFTQRFAFLGDKSNTTFEYAYNKFEPKFANSPNSFGSSVVTQKIDLSRNGQINRYFTYGIGFNTFSDYNSFPSFGSLAIANSLKSINMNLKFNFSRFERKQYFNFNTEMGYYKNPLSPKPKQDFHIKATTNIRLGMFGLNAFTQMGEFYAGELLTKTFQNIDQLQFFTLTPTLQKNFFNNKIHLEAGVTLFRNNINTGGTQFTGRGEYNFNLLDKFYVSYQKYQYRFSQFDLGDIQMGIIKQLPTFTFYDRGQTMTLQLFKDYNGNGKLDNNDSVAADYVIKINTDVLVSDPKGKAVFKRLPQGDYSIGVPPQKGWYAPERQLRVNGSEHIDVPLERNAVVRGLVSYQKESFTSYEVEKKVDGLLIKATDSFGVIYQTKTRESGNFVFFIPPGQYAIEIAPNDLPDKIECRSCKVSMTVGTNEIANVAFLLAIKEQKFKIQKFGSN